MSDLLKSSSCPQCGAPAVPVPGREYLQCQHCESLVFPTGDPANIDRIIPDETQISAQCPVCECGLSTGRIEELPVLFCDGCYGILMRNDAFGTVIRERRSRRNPGSFRISEPLDPTEYERNIHCPSCHRQMEVHPYYGPGNTVIDSCSACQFIWLDHAELSSIERAAGGQEIANQNRW